MDFEKFRVFNPAQEGLLPLDVASVDSVTIPLKMLLEAIINQDNLGLWLNPYRGIPWMPGLPKRDLVFLDENHCVVRDLEQFPCHEVTPFKRAQPASALVLPKHTIFASQIKTGHKLAFLPPGENGERHHSAVTISRSDAESMGLPGAERREENPAPMFQMGNYSAQNGSAGSHAEDGGWATAGEIRKDLLKRRFLGWFMHDVHDRRREKRYRMAGLVAVDQSSDARKVYPIGNISNTGLFLLTQERIPLETTMEITLQRADGFGGDPEVAVASKTKVVRWGPDGVGMAFVWEDSERGGVLKTLAAAV
ncbi:MAG: PilZ domain-containing protein [Acidobacteriota bacterium]|nr:PilZ domain-containing protein [Acidobacteriota bacterium]